MNASGFRTRRESLRTSIVAAAERAGRTDDVALVAVSKTVGVEQLRMAVDAGQYTFGENRVQEATSKMDALFDLAPLISWHLVGHLQTNKAKATVGRFACIQSVDSLRLASELNKRARDAVSPTTVLLEVNVAGETSKSGFEPAVLRRELEAIFELDALRVLGLMTVAPTAPDPEDVRWVFRSLRELRDDIRDRYELGEFSQLSMGMSSDYGVAIEEGATMVRIGRALFGDRPADHRVR